jgi:hypothetical protein
MRHSQGDLSLILVNAVKPMFWRLLNDEATLAMRYHYGAYQPGASSSWPARNPRS